MLDFAASPNTGDGLPIDDLNLDTRETGKIEEDPVGFDKLAPRVQIAGDSNGLPCVFVKNPQDIFLGFGSIRRARTEPNVPAKVADFGHSVQLKKK